MVWPPSCFGPFENGTPFENRTLWTILNPNTFGIRAPTVFRSYLYLLFQADSLDRELSKAQHAAAEGDKARQDLTHLTKRLRQWESACLQLLTPQERLAVGEDSIGIELFNQKVAHCQQDRVMYTDEINSLKAR